MPLNESEAKNALGTFISSIHKNSKTSFWYRVYDSFRDDPEGVEVSNPNSGDEDKRKEALGKKKQLRELYLMYFHLVIGLR